MGRRWEATNPHETGVERSYILDEARELFRNGSNHFFIYLFLTNLS
jgi:hypothetical protein